MPLSYGSMPSPYLERPNVVGNALATYGGIQDLETRRMKNQLLREGLQERQEIRNIMAEEGPLESKWEKVFSISPEAGERMARAINYMKPDEKARYAKIGRWIESTVPMLQRPEQIALWRNDLAKIAPEIAAYVPAADELAQPGMMEKFQQNILSWTKMGQEQLRQEGIRKTKEHEYGLKGVLQSQKDEAAMGRAELAAKSRVEAAEKRTKGGYAPQLVESEEGDLGWAMPGVSEVVPLPGKFRKAKAEGRLDLNKAAMNAALKELQEDSAFTTDPNSPESEAKLEKSYNRHKKLLGGGRGPQINQSDRLAVFRKKLMQIPPELRQEALNRIRQKDPDIYEKLMGQR